jgi:hypothetical protein
VPARHLPFELCACLGFAKVGIFQLSPPFLVKKSQVLSLSAFLSGKIVAYCNWHAFFPLYKNNRLCIEVL